MKLFKFCFRSLITLALLAVGGSVIGQESNRAENFTVTLLGTGTPALNIERFGPSTLVEAGSQRLVFDAGRGASIRLSQIGLGIREVDAFFLTHLHSDHINGLADLWLTGWTFGRTEPMQIYGPSGTKNMMESLRAAYQPDIDIRVADENFPLSGIAVDVYDVSESVIYEKEGVTVTVFDVDHGELIKPAFGYRVDFNGNSVVLSGDTRYSTNLVNIALDTDVLIHEVMSISPQAYAESQRIQRIMDHHTSPEDAGRVFAQSRTKLAVYSHIILGGERGEKEINDMVKRTKTNYSGSLIVGEDLMRIEVSENPRVISPESSRQ